MGLRSKFGCFLEKMNCQDSCRLISCRSKKTVNQIIDTLMNKVSENFVKVFWKLFLLKANLVHRKRSSAGEEAEEETHSEDPRVLSGGRGFSRLQEEGTP